MAKAHRKCLSRTVQQTESCALDILNTVNKTMRHREVQSLSMDEILAGPRAEIEDLKNQVQNEKSKRESVETELTRVFDIMSGFESTVTNLQSQMFDEKNQAEQLKHEKTERLEKMSKLDKQCATLEMNIKHQQNDLTKAKSDLSTAFGIVRKRNAEIERYQKYCQRLKDKLVEVGGESCLESVNSDELYSSESEDESLKSVEINNDGEIV